MLNFYSFVKITVITCVFTLSASLQASLLVHPLEINLTPKNRFGSVKLKNKSNKARHYEIRKVFYAIKNGKFVELEGEELEKVKKKDLSDHLIVTPFRFKLEPGEKQVLRVMSKTPGKLKSPEYRCHIIFKEISAPVALEKINGKEVKTVIETLFSTAIPAIYRNRNAENNGQVKNARLEKLKKGYSLKFNLVNTGNTAFRSDIEVTQNGKLVGRILRASSYENERKIELRMKEVFRPGKKTTKLKLVAKDPFMNSNKVIFTRELNLKTPK